MLQKGSFFSQRVENKIKHVLIMRRHVPVACALGAEDSLQLKSSAHVPSEEVSKISIRVSTLIRTHDRRSPPAWPSTSPPAIIIATASCEGASSLIADHVNFQNASDRFDHSETKMLQIAVLEMHAYTSAEQFNCTLTFMFTLMELQPRR
jgi:hypothetical protein